jgi:hydroxymethylpyrimidine pyrophosphatase-like HAD family hydrolase
MRYFALATDYDGTVADDGRIDEPTAAALKRLRESGRCAVLVTGRELNDLLAICLQIGLFDHVVAENGAVLYHPRTRDTRDLAPPPPPAFIAELARRGVEPVSVGRAIVATWEPHQAAVLEAIRDLGLELHVIFNKGAVMVLPSGVNKAIGLAAALTEQGLSPHNVVGIGDAENDHAFLAATECAVAVANALPALKERADLVTTGARGDGVAELIDRLMANDLEDLGPKLERHRIWLGKRAGGGDKGIDPCGAAAMVCGPSGSGKSTLTTGLLERFAAAGYQFAVIDPEGDYSGLELAVALGSPARAPLIEEVLDLLRDPARNAVVNLLGVALEHRPGFFAELLPRLLELRTRTGRPHWLVVDGAHHLLPAGWHPPEPALANGPKGTLHITVHPGSLAKSVLAGIDVVLAVGGRPGRTIGEYCDAAGEAGPAVPEFDEPPPGSAVLWRRGDPAAVVVRAEPAKTERTRDSRKYAEGNLGPDRSFYFRGPAGKLHLRAQNLALFLQLTDGVDDDTWEFHRSRRDYSGWLRESVKDPDLADEVATIEGSDRSARDSRGAVREAVARRYTLPADAPTGNID